jgi:hypothetical protein
MNRQTTASILLVSLLAGCGLSKPNSAAPPTGQPTAEQVRAALLQMVAASGNNWMADDLKSGPAVKEAHGYRIGRWTFSIQNMTFLFTHANENVTPPIVLQISGVLERDSRGKLTAKVTHARQP